MPTDGLTTRRSATKTLHNRPFRPSHCRHSLTRDDVALDIGVFAPRRGRARLDLGEGDRPTSFALTSAFVALQQREPSGHESKSSRAAPRPRTIGSGRRRQSFRVCWPADSEQARTGRARGAKPCRGSAQSPSGLSLRRFRSVPHDAFRSPVRDAEAGATGRRSSTCSSQTPIPPPASAYCPHRVAGSVHQSPLYNGPNRPYT